MACFVRNLEEFFYQEVEPRKKFPLCHSLVEFLYFSHNPSKHLIFCQSVGFKMMAHSIRSPGSSAPLPVWK